MQYYKVPLSGDDIVCTSKLYSTINIVNATYNWNSKRLSTNGTSYSETATKTSNGSGWIQCKITSFNSGTSIITERKTVWVGAPDLDNITIYYTEDLNQYGEYCPGETNELLAHPEPSIDMGLTYNYWDLGSWDVYAEDGEGYVLFGIPTSFSRSEQLSYEIENACNSAIGTITLYEGSCGGYFVLISPNPGSGETTISLDLPDNGGGTLKSTPTETTLDETTEWDLEIYDNIQNLKLKKQKLKGTKTTINTQSWKEGIYMVRVKYNDEILTGKLVVKK